MFGMCTAKGHSVPIEMWRNYETKAGNRYIYEVIDWLILDTFNVAYNFSHFAAEQNEHYKNGLVAKKFHVEIWLNITITRQ